MREVITDAFVLEKEPIGEFDTRLILFTRILGRVVATATSTRKITSKLAAHLEPFFLLQIRLVEGKGSGEHFRFRIADAMRHSPPFIIGSDSARLLSRLALQGHPEPELWHTLLNSKDIRELLRVLGFDPQEAFCERCGASPPYFSLRESVYYCNSCVRADQLGDYIRLPLVS